MSMERGGPMRPQPQRIHPPKSIKEVPGYLKELLGGFLHALCLYCEIGLGYGALDFIFVKLCSSV